MGNGATGKTTEHLCVSVFFGKQHVLQASSCCTVHTEELLCPFVGFVKCSLISSHLSVIQEAVLIFQFLNSRGVSGQIKVPTRLNPQWHLSKWVFVRVFIPIYPIMPPHPDHWVILWPEKLIIPSCLCCYFRPWGPTGLGVCVSIFGGGWQGWEDFLSLSPSMSLPLSHYSHWAVGVG